MRKSLCERDRRGRAAIKSRVSCEVSGISAGGANPAGGRASPDCVGQHTARSFDGAGGSIVARHKKSRRPDKQEGERAMKPVVLMVGADKGGVGKTTVTRTVLDYLSAKNTLVRAFDAEYPRGTLQRFHPDITEVVDVTTAADQMKMIDTLATSEIKVSVIDIRAGLLDETLKTLTEVGFFDLVDEGEFNFGLMHVVGSSVASLDEIAEVLPYVKGKNYFIVKNFINDTSFFEWNPAIYRSYFKGAAESLEVTIPKLNEMAYEQVELSGVPFSDFVANRSGNGQPAANSLVLRGYVRTWQKQVFAEYDRVGLLNRLYDRTAAAA
jgi:hypothetical protein